MKTQKTLLVNPCGCEVVERERIAGLSPTYHTIEYCPKHAAANAMYEALKLAIPALVKHNTDDSCTEVLSTIYAALKQAEGK